MGIVFHWHFAIYPNQHKHTFPKQYLQLQRPPTAFNPRSPLPADASTLPRPPVQRLINPAADRGLSFSFIQLTSAQLWAHDRSFSGITDLFLQPLRVPRTLQQASGHQRTYQCFKTRGAAPGTVLSCGFVCSGVLRILR